jgi:hypothetical protein
MKIDMSTAIAWLSPRISASSVADLDTLVSFFAAPDVASSEHLLPGKIKSCGHLKSGSQTPAGRSCD